ncbi:transglutaminase family protein [Acetobacter sp. LMG 1636]|uniref:Transglutaminase family protein n=1 Tax=Acetobacter fallax TaxID=1737473 RepID=A0ABX0K3S0_9PROT|nr:transglutaminase family protein [Acetobacter fallax]NHO31029.1 transglutaminase family protein [Acetobacter fallax]NHO34586.1 transglutaminase family protein [Acetobacter fallax]
MEIRAGYDISIEFQAPTPLILMLDIRPEREPDLITPQQPAFEPWVPVQRYIDGFGSRCTRLLAPAGIFRTWAEFTVYDSGRHEQHVYDAKQTPVQDLPSDVLVFLLGSRYCETDLLSDFAWSMFGNSPQGWSRVQAIVDYVHSHITFSYANARNTRTAWEGWNERIGVCRDFAHLAVTLCRCMNIPARYCTGYLGDIGVPVVPDPMDFSAWFEVWLDGVWYTFDARHNVPRIGRIVIARGRDAADVAISTSFGPHLLTSFNVTTYEIV